MGITSSDVTRDEVLDEQWKWILVLSHTKLANNSGIVTREWKHSFTERIKTRMGSQIKL